MSRQASAVTQQRQPRQTFRMFEEWSCPMSPLKSVRLVSTSKALGDTEYISTMFLDSILAYVAHNFTLLANLTISDNISILFYFTI